MLYAVDRIRAIVAHTLRRLGAHPRLLPLTALLLRARTVRPSAAFVARESIGRDPLSADRMSTYRLRQNGLRVAIRHRTGDVVTLGEIFHEPDYRPTPEVERALAAEVTRIVDCDGHGMLWAWRA